MTSTRDIAGAGTAKADWDARIGRRTGAGGIDVTVPAPAELRAAPGRGHVTLDWAPVPGAVGYLVHRSAAAAGPFEVVDHGGNDVLAVPHPPYTDTSGERGQQYWYAVATLSEATVAGPLSDAVEAASAPDGAAAVEVRVGANAIGRLDRPWRPMIGSEHLSLLLTADLVGGRPIGAELREALRLVHDEIGVVSVRAHAILGDDLGVYREVDGVPVHDFSGVDKVYDIVREIGLRPVVELSYMPADLASDLSPTVFDYRANISPPKDWDRWGDLVRALVAHLADRYGLEELRRHWSFEVWNEANLEVFWSGTPDDYLRLYDVTAAAVRGVDEHLIVGGPSSAAAQWVGALLEHAEGSGAAVDFVSTHTYGSPPLDVRPILARYGREDAKIWWTEWGPGSQHFHHVGDTVFAATFLLDGMASSLGRIDALSHWVASDHFEEVGRPTALQHGGFGLLTVGNLRKPRWWALALLDRLGDERLNVTMSGDGADGLISALACRDSAGATGILIWNSSLDQSRISGDALLSREVTVAVAALPAGPLKAQLWRVDEDNNNIFATWQEMGGADRDWPSGAEWDVLRAADQLIPVEEPITAEIGAAGEWSTTLTLPQPGICFIELTP